MLNEGVYRLDVLLQRGQKMLALNEALTLTVKDTSYSRAGFVGAWLGAMRPVFSWKTEKV
jgi:hypothetical protein